MLPAGALAEWLGRGLQSLVRRFESARRLDCKVPELCSPGAVAHALHLPLVVEPAQVDLRRFDLRAAGNRWSASSSPECVSRFAILGPSEPKEPGVDPH